MAKMLRVETCDECKESSAYADYCLYTHRNLDEDTKPRIPAWCELPDAPRWVPVDEELPAIPSGKQDMRIVAIWNGEWREVAYWEDGDWTLPGKWFATDGVTHWLKGMPPLPKEE